MSILRQAFERRATPDLPDTYGQPGAGWWGQGMVWHDRSSAGSTTNAMRLSAVFACLRLLSEAIATMPLDTFVRRGGTRLRFDPRPQYLSFKPPQGSRIDYLSQVMLSLLTDGNAYVLTPRDPLGVPLDLVVLDPTLVQVERRKGKVTYRCLDVDLRLDVDVMHIKGMTLPGAVTGLSPLAAAREAIGLGLNAQAFGDSFFGNGALPGAVIEAPNAMTREAALRFRETWNADHGGVGNANRVGVLTNGAKLSKVSIAPNDAQFLETRQFSVPDIARFYGVPPHLIADASNSTSWGSGLAEQNLAFGQFSLRPWTERVEDQHTRLLATHGLPDVFVKLNLDALLRASLKDRYDAYAVGIDKGVDTINECRALEDKAPVPWGDVPPVSAQVMNDDEITPRDLVEMVQKVYLGVDVVLSAGEAREILNRAGAGLTGPPPGGPQ